MQTSAKKACFQFAECSFSYAKKMQTSAKKACFQFVECSFSYAEDTTFPCNFQGFREKILEKDEEKEKKNRRFPELRAAYWLYYFYYDETNTYSTLQ